MRDTESMEAGALFSDGAEVAPGVVFDFSRRARLGMPEAVFCQGKPAGALFGLMERFGRSSGHPVLFTRLEPDVFAAMPESIRSEYDYHAVSRTAWGVPMEKACGCSVAVVSAGTADGFVTWEVARSLEFAGVECRVFEDCGVAGLWRLGSRLASIAECGIIVVVAGLDAALASVLGGLLPQPMVAVPTSVGYGMASGGRAALNSMLVSCAPGVSVVNIDNGYGAACAALRIHNLLKERRAES